MWPAAEHDLSSELIPLAVTDLKQYLFCPRIPYFQHVLNVPRPVSYKMKHGTLQHVELDRLEKRRGLRSYGLREGQRLFHLPVTSAKLGLHGKLDLVVKDESKQQLRLLPVEFKHQDGPIYPNVKYQLAAYALLLEEAYDTAVDDGVVYQIPTKKIRHVRITDELRSDVRQTLSEIREMMRTERFPDPMTRRRCEECEYRRYCNDIR